MIKTNMYISKNILPFGKAWLGFLLLPFMVACSRDDLEQYAQRADNANEIGFLPRTENVTRANYSLDYPHPETMGVFGFFDLDGIHVTNSDFIIFKNKEVDFSKDQDGIGYWTYSPVRYWPEFSSATDFDFFGYMPYNKSGATLTYFSNGYTLSFTATLSKENMKEGSNLPLICNQPHHKDAPGDIVNFDMDQTTTGFQLKFKLGTKMSNVRDFEITKVVISGNIPYTGKVSRTYIQDEEGNWIWEPEALGTDTRHDIVWSEVKTQNTSFEIKNIDENTDEEKSLILSDDQFHEWGKPFYAIPVKSFTPTIKVTYNVKVADSEKGTVTRENVTNNIVFNENNFANLKLNGLMPGKLNTLEIAIVPDHLYVLADDDQYIGYLEVN